jgi:hypothetical protein
VTREGRMAKLAALPSGARRDLLRVLLADSTDG